MKLSWQAIPLRVASALGIHKILSKEIISYKLTVRGINPSFHFKNPSLITDCVPLPSHLRLGIPNGLVRLDERLYKPLTPLRATCLINLILDLYHLHNIECIVQTKELLVMQFSPVCRNFLPLVNSLFSDTLNLCCSLNVTDHV